MTPFAHLPSSPSFADRASGTACASSACTTVDDAAYNSSDEYAEYAAYGDMSGVVDTSLCQAAAQATQLAMARWRRGQGQSEMQVAAALRARVQERWYMHTLSQLEAWRASGGFGQEQQAAANGQQK